MIPLLCAGNSTPHREVFQEPIAEKAHSPTAPDVPQLARSSVVLQRPQGVRAAQERDRLGEREQFWRLGLD